MDDPGRSLDEPLPAPQRGAAFDAGGDATRRTALAAERTVLAWLRTGLTLTAVALAVGHVIPALGERTTIWPYTVLGAAYALVGVALVVYGLYRGREVARALREGRWTPVDDRVLGIVGAVSVVLGAGAAALIVVGS